MARRSMLTAAACVALATALYLAVVHLALAQRADMSVLARTMDHQTPERASLASDLVTLFNPLPFTILAFGVGGAVLAGRARRARGRRRAGGRERHDPGAEAAAGSPAALPEPITTWTPRRG
jgi:hypothetical protein